MKSSYRHIFATTSLVGGTQVINILIGIIRGKAMALLIGASGVGLAGMYQSAVGLIEVISGLGLRDAGVRSVAISYSSRDSAQCSRTAVVLIRTALLGGIAGMFITVVFRRAIAQVTFGNDTYASGVGYMSLTVLLGCVAAAYGAYLQGMRKISLLAASSVVATACASVAGLAAVLALRQDGIVLMHVLGSLTGCLVLWFFARRFQIGTLRLSLREWAAEAHDMVRLGFALMVASLATVGGAYVANVIILRAFGITGVGLYLASWTLAGSYVKMILSAMGSDFYPRITALVKTDGPVNRVVNEQMQLGVLIALPGVLFTLTFAPWILRILTSAEFVPAAAITRWQVMSAAIQALSWPMSYVVLAHGRSRLYMTTECLTVAVWLALLWCGLQQWGLAGAGVAHLILHLCYALAMRGVTGRVGGFRFTPPTLLIAGGAAAFAGGCYTWVCTQAEVPALIGGAVLTLVASVLCLLLIGMLTGLTPRGIWRRVMNKGAGTDE